MLGKCTLNRNSDTSLCWCSVSVRYVRPMTSQLDYSERRSLSGYCQVTPANARGRFIEEAIALKRLKWREWHFLQDVNTHGIIKNKRLWLTKRAFKWPLSWDLIRRLLWRRNKFVAIITVDSQFDCVCLPIHAQINIICMFVSTSDLSHDIFITLILIMNKV